MTIPATLNTSKQIKVCTSYSLIVRYLPEVVPYFRKAAILSEIGWQLTEDSDKRCEDQTRVLAELGDEMELRRSDGVAANGQCSQANSDCKTIPLTGAFVRRLYLSKVEVSGTGLISKSKSSFSPETEYDAVTTENSFSESASLPQEVVVIQSPNLSKYCILRFNSDVKCCSWFCAIEKTISELNLPIIQSLNLKKPRDYFDDAEIVYMGWFIERKELQALFSEVIDAFLCFLMVHFVF